MNTSINQTENLLFMTLLQLIVHGRHGGATRMPMFSAPGANRA